MTERDLKQIRHSLTEKTVEVLSCYRKNFAVSTPPGQLVLPESLREFSMYMLAILKCRAFRGLPPMLHPFDISLQIFAIDQGYF